MHKGNAAINQNIKKEFIIGLTMKIYKKYKIITVHNENIKKQRFFNSTHKCVENKKINESP